MGSSARISGGWLISARAMQTRCCSPPESCARQVVQAVGEADAAQRLLGLGAVGHAVDVLRQHDVLERGQVGDQVELLEDEARRVRCR